MGQPLQKARCSPAILAGVFSTDTNMADLFTKPLQQVTFDRLLKFSLGHKSASILRGRQDMTVAMDSSLFMLVDC